MINFKHTFIVSSGCPTISPTEFEIVAAIIESKNIILFLLFIYLNFNSN